VKENEEGVNETLNLSVAWCKWLEIQMKLKPSDPSVATGKSESYKP